MAHQGKQDFAAGKPQGDDSVFDVCSELAEGFPCGWDMLESKKEYQDEVLDVCSESAEGFPCGLFLLEAENTGLPAEPAADSESVA